MEKKQHTDTKFIEKKARTAETKSADGTEASVVHSKNSNSISTSISNSNSTSTSHPMSPIFIGKTVPILNESISGLVKENLENLKQCAEVELEFDLSK